MRRTIRTWHAGDPIDPQHMQSIELHQPTLKRAQDPRYADANPGSDSFRYTYKNWENRQTQLGPQ